MEQETNRLTETDKPKRIGHRFQPGVSGNPKGRPPRRSADDFLREAVLTRKGRRIKSVNEKLIARAESGNVPAMKLLYERIGGKPKQADAVGATPEAAMTLEQVRQRLAELLARPEVRQGLLSMLEMPKDAAVQ